MKSITLTADEKLIEAARTRALSERITLDEAFARWLADYAKSTPDTEAAMKTIRDLQNRVSSGGSSLTRDELNER